MRGFRAFLSDDRGAVTIDWTALAAGILLLGIAVVYAVFGNGVEPLVEQINGDLKAANAAVVVPDAPDLALADGGYLGALPFEFAPGTLVENDDGSYVGRQSDGSVSDYGSENLSRVTVNGTTYLTTTDQGGSPVLVGSFDRFAEYDASDGSFTTDWTTE